MERIHIPNSNEKEKTNLWYSVKTVLKDRAILSIVLISICFFEANGITSTLNQYLFLDYFKDTKYLALASSVMLFAMLLNAPFATKIGVKLGKKEGSVISFGVAVICYVILFVGRVESPVVFIILMFLAFLGMGFFSMMNWAMISDCIDNYYVENKVRADGTIYAMYSFLKKLAGAVTGSIGAWVLTDIGYESSAVVQTDEVTNAIYTASTGIPILFFAVGFIIIVFLYPLNKRKVEENAKKIRKMAGLEKK